MKKVPQHIQDIYDQINAGESVETMAAKTKMKPEVIQQIFQSVKSGMTPEDIMKDPILNKVYGYTQTDRNQQTGDATSQYEKYDDGAKYGYYKKKLTEALAKKAPEKWAKIAPVWTQMAKDEVQKPGYNNAQSRQRVAQEVDKGETRLNPDELKQLLGKDFDEFNRIRKAYHSFNNGISQNSEKDMAGFGFEDLAPRVSESLGVSDGTYYRPNYDGNELSVETNIPGLQSRIKKRKQLATLGTAGTAVAKQAP